MVSNFHRIKKMALALTIQFTFSSHVLRTSKSTQSYFRHIRNFYAFIVNLWIN